ncbi:MAG TPA: hypothetical protein VGG28_04925 [Kofleriaceae bacterium]|jgi:hypothetical protein
MRLVAIAILVAACSNHDTRGKDVPYVVTHLAMRAQNDVNPEQFYARVKRMLDGPHTARVARHGDRLVLITSAFGCSTLRSIEDIVPNGGEVECRDGDTGQVLWLVERDAQPQE